MPGFGGSMPQRLPYRPPTVRQPAPPQAPPRVTTSGMGSGATNQRAGITEGGRLPLPGSPEYSRQYGAWMRTAEGQRTLSQQESSNAARTNSLNPASRGYNPAADAASRTAMADPRTTSANPGDRWAAVTNWSQQVGNANAPEPQRPMVDTSAAAAALAKRRGF